MDIRNWYRRVYGFNLYNRNRWVVEWATRIPAHSKVLDVGAGSGRYRPFFNHCEYRTHDFGRSLDMKGKYTKLDYQSDITEIPVPDESFDVILCTEVLEHVPKPINALREMARILKGGGRLLLTAPLGAFLHQEPYHFYGGFTPHWYRKFLADANFEIESIEANQGFFSLFGQEAVRFSSLISPRRTIHKGLLIWFCLTIFWLMLLPFLRGLFPLIGSLMDRLRLERMATVGYHIVAIKNDS